MIEVSNLSLKIKDKIILSRINLCMEDGKIYGLSGNNGCGKTMLMKCICGFVRPTDGTVAADQKVIGKDMDYLEDAGVIIETPGFVPYYTGLKNLKLLAGIRRKADVGHLESVMKRCGLEPKLKLPVKKYSLGMRQRLGIAQAVMEDQKYLILDEPMNGLDKSGVKDMRELLLELRSQGKLIILASHNKADIDILCDRVYEMDDGAVINEVVSDKGTAHTDKTANQFGISGDENKKSSEDFLVSTNMNKKT